MTVLEIKSSLLNLSHDDATFLIALFGGIFGVWKTYLSFRNRKDIDGVAAHVQTKRAVGNGLCESSEKPDEKKP